ncbi:hypothetical protein JHK85_008876 [Glycine max]|uniref:Uncharacterized protein n=1 Tax=Glycine max TaxID=3847 RepID=A0A0R0K5U2_SOYBN|nr:hypothetical protein JHK87_008490 [Glycine soja]KAG5047773.1 hypothetical protein JHK85_008876 [Glycine max]KAH1109085.1 hypothetical protein GYH30_008468 [Glycine max]
MFLPFVYLIIKLFYIVIDWRESEGRGGIFLSFCCLVQFLGWEGSKIPHLIFSPLQYWGDLEGTEEGKGI